MYFCLFYTLVSFLFYSSLVIFMLDIVVVHVVACRFLPTNNQSDNQLDKHCCFRCHFGCCEVMPFFVLMWALMLLPITRSTLSVIDSH